MSGNKEDDLTSGSVGQTNQKSQLSRTERFNRFLYNKENKKICGRTWKNWICLWIYYIAAYCLFFALFAILIIGDYKARDKNDPQHNIYYFQPFLQEPGMTVIPKGDRNYYGTVINVLDTSGNVAEINKFISDYPKEATIQDCRKHDEPKRCRMDYPMLGECSPDVDPNFGYATQEPCILLKVNKIWGWMPKLYGSRPPGLNEGVNFTSSSMPISCEQWSKPLDEVVYKGTFKEVHIYPSDGFSGNCFPYCGKNREYPQPFVMVKFKGIDTTEKIAIVCVLYAENIKDSREDSGKLLDRIASIIFILNAKRNP